MFKNKRRWKIVSVRRLNVHLSSEAEDMFVFVVYGIKLVLWDV